MEKQTKSIHSLRQRKMFLVLPLLTLPFISLLFWLLGGGEVETADVNADEKEGFNITLPIPNFKNEPLLDKMSYYDKAILDSTKIRELIKKDPNYLQHSIFGDSAIVGANGNQEDNSFRRRGGGLTSNIYRDPNEEKMHKKLEELQKLIDKPVPTPKQPVYKVYEDQSSSSLHSKDVDRLEQMMQSMSQSESEDPELQKLSGMLENILDIQHPDRVQEKMRKTSEANKGQVFTISTIGNDDRITSLENSKKSNNADIGIQTAYNAFYSFEEPINASVVHNAVEAVIHETQTLVNGSTVKLRLSNAIFVNGVMIPKDHFLFGIASLKGERLTVKINSLRFGNSIFPVELSVYDMDGLEGIYIPGAINRDVAKTTADRSMQSLGLNTFDESWGAQAAGAGIEAAKNLLSKKVKLVKVMVKAGYQVLIRDENRKE
ncbi:conjugative transposon protein TraM [Flavobacterium granuli]|uniref:Conjugative transposon TraM protein n=1 Tax=Flavobacterium granuli TaxID=280093 RepID=A0A1M5RP44_9FLAO|nr:conjugative transposon protein TraM [Flavobacterium granuli]PRZ22799.1 conjugative transposon TraM protein [Flavobacterium granuli]SHH28097.1 Bacteroides conjugative transposon TraM protein [Flavobacterium granuli]